MLFKIALTKSSCALANFRKRWFFTQVKFGTFTFFKHSLVANYHVEITLTTRFLHWPYRQWGHMTF